MRVVALVWFSEVHHICIVCLVCLHRCSRIGPSVQTLVLEGSPLPIPQLLGLQDLGQGQHKRLCTDYCKLHESEVAFIAQLLLPHAEMGQLHAASPQLDRSYPVRNVAPGLP